MTDAGSADESPTSRGRKADDAVVAAGASPTRIYTAERAKAFIDAVVAIAMTLLILPLTESFGDLAGGDQGLGGWFVAHSDQLVSFVLSFALIAMFWINHHRLFSWVDQVSARLLWVVMAWLLSIVWLPVATAMSGEMSSKDALVRSVYIGSMILVALLSLVVRLYLQQHALLHHASRAELRSGMAVDLAMAFLFAAALAVGLIWPPLGYFPLFLMLLSGPVQAVFRRMLRVATRDR